MLNVAQVSSLVERGIVISQKSVLSWSDGQIWLGDVGAEGIMHAHICETLHKGGAGIVQPEGAMSSLKDGVKKRTGQKGRVRHAMRGSGRGDIMLFDPNKRDWAPYAIVEVKRAQSNDGWNSDINRLSAAMIKYGKKDHELDFCCLGVYLQASSLESYQRFTTRLTDLAAEQKKTHEKDGLRIELRNYGTKKDRFVSTDEGYDGELYHWGAFSVSIMRKGMNFVR